MLSTETKKCDICRKEFPLSKDFIHLSIEWKHSDNGRYSNYDMCERCYEELSECMKLLISSVKFDMRHYAAQEEKEV